MNSIPVRAALLAVLALISGGHVHAQDGDAYPRIAQYCSAREVSVPMMIEGRDKGIAKEQVQSQLAPLTDSSGDALRATYSRLRDVYAMPRIGARTMSAYRFLGCLFGTMANKEPVFRPEVEEGLLVCQNLVGTADEHLNCVGTALRKQLAR
jgi:hypothetical protein